MSKLHPDVLEYTLVTFDRAKELGWSSSKMKQHNDRVRLKRKAKGHPVSSRRPSFPK